MRNWLGVPALLLTATLAYGGVAIAQTKPDCPKAEKIEGQVTKVDMAAGKLTVQGSDGKAYEFNGTKETLQDKKVGDKIEVTRRMPEGCK